MKPLHDANSSPLCFGDCASSPSIVLRPNGRAPAISSGSSSAAKFDPDSARAFPTVLIAIFLMEQPDSDTAATSTTSKRT